MMYSSTLAAGARPALAGLRRATSSTLHRGTKWFGRVSTVFAVAASFRFLGTEPGGPATRINLALHDATKDYEHFQSEHAKTEQLLADAVIQKAWQARPAPLQQAQRPVKDQKSDSKLLKHSAKV